MGEASGDGSPGDGDMDADRRLEEIRVGDAAGLLLLLLLCVVVAVMTDFSDKIACSRRERVVSTVDVGPVGGGGDSVQWGRFLSSRGDPGRRSKQSPS